MAGQVERLHKCEMTGMISRAALRFTVMAVIIVIVAVALVWRFFDRAQWWWLWGL